MNIAHRLIVALTALLLAPSGSSADEPTQAHDDIRAAAEAHVLEQVRASHGGRVEVEAARLDARLRLAPCGEPLEASLSAGAQLSGRTTVSVRCPGPKPWSLYVPVSIAAYGEVVVANRSMARGTLLSEDDLQVVEQDLAGLPFGYLTDTGEVDGTQLKRPVTAGTVLTPMMLEAPRLVRRGQRVTLLAQTGGIEIRMVGKALADGTSGERVRVRNLSSKRVVEGTVISPGVVQVAM